MKTGSKTLRTQGKMAWKTVVPGFKKNSVEGSTPGESAVCPLNRNKGGRHSCHVTVELLGFFPLCFPLYYFLQIAPTDRYSNDL